MESIHGLQLMVVLCLGIFMVSTWCQHNGDAITAVYIVTLKQAPTSHYYGEQLRVKSGNGLKHDGASGSTTRLDTPRNNSRGNGHKSSYIDRVHDSLLRSVLRGERYLKLYSYHYLINGFAVLVTPQQVWYAVEMMRFSIKEYIVFCNLLYCSFLVINLAILLNLKAEKLSRRREVANVVLDFTVRTATTHTPQFLGLPQGAWAQEGGYELAGEGVVIGFIDTGIDPTHPSFSDDLSESPYPVPEHFSGICEVTRDFPSGSCNRKLIGARHFAASAITRGIFNASQDYASPIDGDGHGT
ncbi:hypothetical protein CsSME_00029586 [Camellia sinensis var. sinensis]